MPLQPGEVALLTLFADVHYYFNSPASKPVHHRFDKSSYVYLFHDAINKRGRVEIANHAGTADQDAFQGFLDRSIIDYSPKHPTLFTITIEPPGSANQQQDASHWQLPTFDPRNETKYMYKLHTVDLYFWTVDDATMFLDSLKRCLRPQQIRVLGSSAEHSEHRDSMSPVVQQLEKAAISSPAYVDRNNSVGAAQPSTAPGSAQTPVSPLAASPAQQPASVAEPASFAPMAYNPAAPGAPEPIAHREKTPPPADAAAGTGLTQAAMHDQGAAAYAQQPGALQHQGSFPVQPQQQYMPGITQQASMPPPPAQQLQRTNTTGSFPPPPPQQQSPFQAGSPGSQQGQQYAQAFAAPPQQAQHDPNAALYAQQQQQQQQQQHPGLQRQSTLPSQYQQPYAQSHTPQPQPISPPAHQQSFSPQPTPQYANYHPGVAAHPSQASPGFQPPPPPPSQPSYQIGQPAKAGYGQPMPSPGFAPPQTQPQQQAPIGGYSTYSYGQAGPGTPQPHDAYAMHQQVYRPTEAEAGHSAGGQNLQAGQPAQAAQGQQQTGALGQRIDKYEKGVSKFFKRLDKKF